MKNLEHFKFSILSCARGVGSPSILRHCGGKNLVPWSGTSVYQWHATVIYPRMHTITICWDNPFNWFFLVMAKSKVQVSWPICPMWHWAILHDLEPCTTHLPQHISWGNLLLSFHNFLSTQITSTQINAIRALFYRWYIVTGQCLQLPETSWAGTLQYTVTVYFLKSEAQFTYWKHNACILGTLPFCCSPEHQLWSH